MRFTHKSVSPFGETPFGTTQKDEIMILVIDSYGAYVHVKDDMFEVRVKKGDEIIRRKIAPPKITSMHLFKGVSISVDAIELAMLHNIEILFMQFEGTPYGRVWSSKLGSTTKIRKRQLVASITYDGIVYVKEWITAKISNQRDFLKRLKKHREDRAPLFINVINKLDEKIDAINNLRGENISEIADELRGYEGSAGKEYFRVLGQILSDEYKFETRSFRPARDPFNAFLNYAYSVLYSKVERALLIAGVDPYLGFLHRDDYNQKSMVYDFIEPFRIYADEAVFKLFSAKKVNKKHTDKITGGYSLNKEGKMLLMEAFNKFMEDEKVMFRNRKQSRNNIIQLSAHAFAMKLVKKKFDWEAIEKYDLLGDV